MKIITLDEDRFQSYIKNHRYTNPYQTTNYAKVMNKEGYSYDLFGFLNNSNELIGATMIIYKKAILNYKIAYAPYGFLVDYSDVDLIKELTEKLKLILFKRKIIYLKLNPNIYCSERDKDGNIISYNPEVNDIIEILIKNGYNHTGFNNYFENLKPRWNAIVKLTASNNKLYKNFNKQTRNKISKAIRSGIIIKQGTEDDIEILYNFIKRKHNHSLRYYKNLIEEYGNDAKIYLAKVNPEKYVNYAKDEYEKEITTNEDYNNQLRELSIRGRDLTTIINKKMESDKRLNIYQKNLIKATNLLSKYPDGITVGGILTIIHNKTMYMIIEGFDKKYSEFNPNYLLKWELIKTLNENEFQYFNLNGIVGEFKEKNKYSGLNEMKLGFNAIAVEYIGEFDLIINNTVYNIYKNLSTKKETKF